jgi:nicotinamide riboside kinase
MLVSFTGAQSTGKSTLLSKCMNDPIFSDFEFVEEVTRLVKRQHNVSINEAGDSATQLLIMSQHMINFANHQATINKTRSGTILDRCVVDGLIYSRHLQSIGRLNSKDVNIVRCIYEHIINDIDVIFYTESSDVPLIDDGERSDSVDFRRSIVNLYDKWLNQFNGNVVRLSGSVDERYNTIKSTIKNFK